MFGGGGVGGGGGSGLPGAPGKSAYQVAVDNGFTGTQSEWLVSLDGTDGAPGPQGTPGSVGPPGDPGPKGLDGEDAYHLALDNGFAGSLTEWFTSLKGDKGDKGDAGDTGPQGLSAFEVAVASGFSGTEDGWLASLKGTDGAQGPRGYQGLQGVAGNDGTPGKTAYEVALDNGFVGTQSDWLLSIRGTDGAQGVKGDTGAQGPVGPAGTDGLNGKSAYELATSGGYSGTVNDWLVSLHGADGAQGPKGDTGDPGTNGVDGNSAYQLAIAQGFVGTLSDWLASLKGADGAQGVQGDQGIQGFQGQPGTPGINGNSVLNGNGAPAAGLGNDGDYYINNTTNVIYGPRAAGAWPAGGTPLVGPQGPQGVQGTQGPAGTNGNTLLNGSGTPASATGHDGDFYLDTAANVIYGPRSVGLWPDAGTSLVGPQGLQGVQGNPGTAGSDGANGKSAYELAVAQGYSGTMSQWLASLQGTDGAQGPQGPAGVVAAGVHGDVTVASDSTFTVTRAAQLTTARLINGVAFNGTADITINAVDATPRIASSLIGVANGIASLGSDGKVPAAQLPSYVDDVVEYANLAAFPASGETGKIYIADDTNWEYRWTGTQYLRIVASPGTTDALAEGAVNLYFTTARAIAALANATIAGTVTTTGFITSGGAVTSTNGIVISQNTAGNQAVFQLRRGALNRFAVLLDGSAEAGGNANTGGNFAISRHNDDGTWLDNAFSITRSTGDATITHNLTVNGAVAVVGNLTVNGGRQVVGIGADGGMEVGGYIDFHSPNADGADYRVRIQADSSGSLFLDPTSDVVNIWATQLYLGGGAQNLLIQHDGTNGYIQTLLNKGDLLLGANGGSRFQITGSGDLINLSNGHGYQWTDASGTHPLLTCQTDNNFVFYGTGSTGAARSIFSILMRSDTSALGINVDTTFVSGTVNVRGATMMQLLHDGANGYIQAKTGQLILGANGNNSIFINTDGSVTSGQQWNFTTTQTFTGTGNQMILKNGTASNPSLIFRSDGASFFLLKSAASTGPNGVWDTTRPFVLNLTSGDITMSQNLSVSGITYGANFQTFGSTGAYVVNSRDTGAGWTIYNSGGTFRLWSGADRFTLDANGNVGAHDFYADRGDGTGVIYFGNPANSHYCYWDGTYYRFNNGAIAINGQLQVDSSANISGALTVVGNITYTSDARKKSNIRLLDDASGVLSLNAYRFEKDGREEIGFIAQEVEEHIPEAVHTDEDGWKSLNDVPILAQLLEQVKALTAEVEALKAAR